MRRGEYPITNTQYPMFKEMKTLSLGNWKFDIGYCDERRFKEKKGKL
jgi:hypothetical protein